MSIDKKSQRHPSICKRTPLTLIINATAINGKSTCHLPQIATSFVTFYRTKDGLLQ